MALAASDRHAADRPIHPSVTILGVQSLILFLSFLDPLLHHVGWVTGLMIALPLPAALSVTVSETLATAEKFARIVFTAEVILTSCAITLFYLGSSPL